MEVSSSLQSLFVSLETKLINMYSKKCLAKEGALSQTENQNAGMLNLSWKGWPSPHL
jgi:hypothetical protein